MENIEKSQLYPCLSSNENDAFENLPTFNVLNWAQKISKVRKDINIKTIIDNIYAFFNFYSHGVREHTYIISLAEDYDNLLMWSHYADNHKGICIGYDLSNYKEDGYNRLPIMKVKYSSKRVYWPDDLFGITTKQLLAREDLLNVLIETMTTKSEVWSYEKEHRIVAINEERIESNIEHSGIIKEIYIGCNVDSKVVKEIIGFVKNTNKKIKVYKMKRDTKEFKLIVKE